MEPAIRVENLSKQYRIYRNIKTENGHGSALQRTSNPFRYLWNSLRRPEEGEILWALKDVSFEVMPGEAMGVLGKNGAGKSTLLKILSRITDPTSGRATLNGKVRSLLEVGTGFHPELTGRENVYMNGAILGMRKAEIDRKFDEIVDFAGIEKFIDTPVKRYSSGMYVRLAFAVAAHLEPEILLVDEVLAVGDAEFQKKCLGKMGDISEEGRTVLFVSHNMVALQNLCPNAIWLDEGAIKEKGPASDLIAAYFQFSFDDVSEREWPDIESAPGNDLVKIRRIWIISEKEGSVNIFPREWPIRFGIEYWKFDAETEIHITIQFVVEQQIIAFSSASSYGANWLKRTKKKGLFRSNCQIPANFLNTGQYRINIVIVKDRSTGIFNLKDAISFDVIETKIRTGMWFGKPLGVIRPLLPWDTKFLNKI